MRFELFEIHDQPWFPDFLRREVVDALQMILERTDAYKPIAGRLRQALNRLPKEINHDPECPSAFAIK